jgi:hypothetical protein
MSAELDLVLGQYGREIRGKFADFLRKMVEAAGVEFETPGFSN